VTDVIIPSAWPRDVARHVLDRVDSTNAEAMRLADRIAGPAWIMARRQEAGRGRRGRAWTDPPGNFAATLLIRPQGGPADAARLSFVAALAVHDALMTLCGPQLNLALKWPNDLLLNGGKLSGILLESAGSGRQVTALAIGIGVNLACAPEIAADQSIRPVSLKGETGLAVDERARVCGQRPSDTSGDGAERVDVRAAVGADVEAGEGKARVGAVHVGPARVGLQPEHRGARLPVVAGLAAGQHARRAHGVAEDRASEGIPDVDEAEGRSRVHAHVGPAPVVAGRIAGARAQWNCRGGDRHQKAGAGQAHACFSPMSMREISRDSAPHFEAMRGVPAARVCCDS
jgi:hypothetical protein